MELLVVGSQSSANDQLGGSCPKATPILPREPPGFAVQSLFQARISNPGLFTRNNKKRSSIMKFYTGNENINGLVDSAMDKIKTIVDSSTVIGEKVTTEDGTTIIPISRVTVGYVVGGGEYADLSARRVANHFPMAGGSSGGMSVSPVGFLIISDGSVRFINVENKSLYQTVLNMFNLLMSKIEAKDKEKAEQSQNDQPDKTSEAKHE